MAEKCTNTSSPVERWIKPYPLAPLNHFTVPLSFTDNSFRLKNETFPSAVPSESPTAFGLLGDSSVVVRMLAPLARRADIYPRRPIRNAETPRRRVPARRYDNRCRATRYAARGSGSDGLRVKKTACTNTSTCIADVFGAVRG